MTQQVFLKLPEVQKRTALSRSEIYRRESSGTFPRRIKLGDGEKSKAVAWLESEIINWCDQRIRASRPHISSQPQEAA